MEVPAPLVPAVLVAVAEASVPAVAVASDSVSDRVLSLAETRTRPVRVAARATARIGPRAFMAGSVPGGPPARLSSSPYLSHRPCRGRLSRSFGVGGHGFGAGRGGWFGPMPQRPAGAAGRVWSWRRSRVRVCSGGLGRSAPPRSGVGGVGGGAGGLGAGAGGMGRTRRGGGAFGDSVFALAQVAWGDLRHRERGRRGAERLGLCLQVSPGVRRPGPTRMAGAS